MVHLLGGGQHVVLLRCQLSPESRGHTQQGLVSYHFSASASLGEPERCRAVPTAAPSNMNRRNAHARKASIQPTKTLSKGLHPKQQKQRPNVCFNWNYNRPCHTTQCMNVSSAFQKSTHSWIVPRDSKGAYILCWLRE